MNDSLIVENLSKSFKLYHEKSKSIFDLIRTVINKNPYETLHVLNDISFSVKKGEMLGILGKNGIGKYSPLFFFVFLLCVPFCFLSIAMPLSHHRNIWYLRKNLSPIEACLIIKMYMKTRLKHLNWQ